MITKFINQNDFCKILDFQSLHHDHVRAAADKSDVRKRYFHWTEETLAGHPAFLDPAQPSLDARLAAAAGAVPELAAAAAARAIAEWGRPAAEAPTSRTSC